MPNLRIIHNNAADRATLSASTTAGTLAAGNLLTDLKGQFHRSTGTSVTYTLTWAALEAVGGVALPATNLTAAATLRVRGYSDAAGTALVIDSGTAPACPGHSLSAADWPAPLNGNSFAYGGLAKAVRWLASSVNVRRLVIDLVDAANPAGFIDCARIVAGAWWSPRYNAQYGAACTLQDNTVNRRSDAGDLLSDRAPVHELLPLDLKLMPEADRATLARLIRRNGVYRPVFLALMPEDGTQLEQDSMIYGKRANSPLGFDFYNAFSHKFDMEGW